MIISMHQINPLPSTLEALVRSGSLSPNAGNEADDTMRSSDPELIIVSGNTGSGKSCLASCLATSAGAKRPVFTLEDISSIGVHRRQSFALPEVDTTAEALTLLEARLEHCRKLGENPALVIETGSEAIKWALNSPIARSFTRVILIQSGSSTGAIVRVADAAGLSLAAVAKEVGLALHCKSVRVGGTGRHQIEAASILGIKEGKILTQII